MKILQTTLEFAKEFVKLQWVTQFVVIIALAYAAFAIRSCNTNTKFEQFTVEYEQVLRDRTRIAQHAAALEKEADQLAQQATVLQDTITRLKFTVSLRTAERAKLKTNLDSLQATLASATDTAEIVVAQQHIIGNLEGQLANADSINVTTQTILVNTEAQREFFKRAYELSDQRGDSLQRLVNSLPTLPQDPNKWIFGLPKPTRTQVAIVAATAGAVGGYKLHQALSNQRPVYAR
jgi:septal ring factor EnvC (AmiA/AmiB activator)